MLPPLHGNSILIFNPPDKTSMIKKLLLVGSVLGIAISQVRAASATLNFTLGILSDSTGTAIPDGSLLQVIAAPTSSTFANPTTTSFLGGSSDEYLLFSGSFNSSSIGISGATQQPVTIDLNTTPVGNYAILVRWYPSLTTSNSAPGSTTYGQFGYPEDSTWFIPSGGGTVGYSFLTTSAGGSYPDSMGQASNTITPVPEPSSYALIIGFCTVLIAMRHRRSSVLRTEAN